MKKLSVKPLYLIVSHLHLLFGCILSTLNKDVMMMMMMMMMKTMMSVYVRIYVIFFFCMVAYLHMHAEVRHLGRYCSFFLHLYQVKVHSYSREIENIP